MKSGVIHPGEQKPQHIETVISNVFIFERRVYKFYKNDNDFFNKGFRDLSGKNDRFAFTKRDFEWNRKLSPSIYIGLKGARVYNKTIEFSDSYDNSEELVIIMNRINNDDILFEKLMKGGITGEISSSIGKQLAVSLKKVRTENISGYNYYEFFEKKIRDLKEWMASVPEFISKEECSEYCDFLEMFRNENRDWFEGELSDELAHTGDIHSQNAVLSNRLFHLMDTFPPKDEWMIEHHLFPMYRIGADIWALSGDQKIFEAFLKGYEEGSGIKIDRRLDDLYIIYALGVRVAYFYMLERTDVSKKEPATRFHKFIRDYFRSKRKRLSPV